MPLGANKAALFGSSGVATDTSILLATGVASSSASLTFTLPTIYKQVVFGFYNVAAATDGAMLTFQVNAAGGSGFGETMTTTNFTVYHTPTDSHAALAYQAASDQAQGTGYQSLCEGISNDADHSAAGILNLFNPASTTYVKNFYSTVQYAASWQNAVTTQRVAGYINTATNLSEINFKMNSGNIASGTIKMWGVL